MLLIGLSFLSYCYLSIFSDKTGQLTEMNKNLLEAAAEKDRLDAEVAYLKRRLDGYVYL